MSQSQSKGKDVLAQLENLAIAEKGAEDSTGKLLRIGSRAPPTGKLHAFACLQCSSAIGLWVCSGAVLLVCL
jgi:hypothetical protein